MKAKRNLALWPLRAGGGGDLLLHIHVDDMLYDDVVICQSFETPQGFHIVKQQQKEEINLFCYCPDGMQVTNNLMYMDHFAISLKLVLRFILLYLKTIRLFKKQYNSII